MPESPTTRSQVDSIEHAASSPFDFTTTPGAVPIKRKYSAEKPEWLEVVQDVPSESVVVTLTFAELGPTLFVTRISNHRASPFTAAKVTLVTEDFR